jgi:hypothetical protein
MGIIKAGVCLHLKVEGYPDPHLHIVLTDPYGEPAEVVIVSLRTYKGDNALGYDPTVRLKPGDGVHSFVKRDTYVFYKWARRMAVARLERIIKDDLTVKDREACPAQMLTTIQDGLLASKFPKKGVQSYCKERWATQQARVKPEPASPEVPKRDS